MVKAFQSLIGFQVFSGYLTYRFRGSSGVSIPNRVLGIFRRSESKSQGFGIVVSIPNRVLGIFRLGYRSTSPATKTRFQSLIGFQVFSGAKALPFSKSEFAFQSLIGFQVFSGLQKALTTAQQGVSIPNRVLGIFRLVLRIESHSSKVSIPNRVLGIFRPGVKASNVRV